MRILLTGSTGFIGSTLKQQLGNAGHAVRGCVSPRHPPQADHSLVVDFARDTAVDTWLPRLAEIDVVINAVGVLRDSRSNPIEAIHRDTPAALFSACAKAGVKHIIHISALGVDQSQTRYATTKRAAEEHLIGLAQQHPQLQVTILRPSVVFGKGGDSSALFMQLACLPVAIFPGPMLKAKVQPVSVWDLAQAVVQLLAQPSPPANVPEPATTAMHPAALPAAPPAGLTPAHNVKMMECTGPAALTMGDFVASLRQQRGYAPARVLQLPAPLTQLSARIGDMLPGIPWCTEALAMLAVDNTGDYRPLEQLLGRTPVHYNQLLAQAWETAGGKSLPKK